ncbi:MAG: hypothetical protein HY675_20615 [Chloroflexi bacterium]|nr:hypothetical protein [Chloroflexota bacterium]
MVRTSHVLLAVTDFKKATEFFQHLGYEKFTSAVMREKPSPEIQAGRQVAEPDQVSVLVDERGFVIDLTLWYDTMRRYFGRSDAITIRVENLDAVWASLESFPGVRRLSPPSKVSAEMMKAIDKIDPGRFAIISVDLDREDGEEQLIELIEGLVPEYLA